MTNYEERDTYGMYKPNAGCDLHAYYGTEP